MWRRTQKAKRLYLVGQSSRICACPRNADSLARLTSIEHSVTPNANRLGKVQSQVDHVTLHNSVKSAQSTSVPVVSRSSSNSRLSTHCIAHRLSQLIILLPRTLGSGDSFPGHHCSAIPRSTICRHHTKEHVCMRTSMTATTPRVTLPSMRDGAQAPTRWCGRSKR